MMNEATGNRFSLTREEFLDNFVQLLNATKDYQELIATVEAEEDPDPQEFKALILDKVNRLKLGGVNTRSMELIGTYLRFSLERFTGDKLQFLLPDDLDDGFFTINDGFVDLSSRIESAGQELREIEEKVYFLTRMLPPQNIDKIRLLLKAVSSLFKSIIRKDFEDLEPGRSV